VFQVNGDVQIGFALHVAVSQTNGGEQIGSVMQIERGGSNVAPHENGGVQMGTASHFFVAAFHENGDGQVGDASHFFATAFHEYGGGQGLGVLVEVAKAGAWTILSKLN
jgi:hypothetical protein